MDFVSRYASLRPCLFTYAWILITLSLRFSCLVHENDSLQKDGHAFVQAVCAKMKWNINAKDLIHSSCITTRHSRLETKFQVPVKKNHIFTGHTCHCHAIRCSQNATCISQMQRGGLLPMAGTQPSLVSVPAGPGHKSVQEGTQVLNAYSSAEHLGNGSRPRKGQEILLHCRPQTNTSTFAYPEVVAAGR